MNRIQLACFGLVASAFVLGGMLVIQLAERQDMSLATSAHAGQVIARENLTLLTATSREDEESLFVLDGSTGQLAIYRFDPTGNRLMYAGRADMNQVFGDALGGNLREQRRADEDENGGEDEPRGRLER